MADISKETQDLLEAVYGEEVRGSLVSLANKVNAESTAARESAVKTVELAAGAADEAAAAAEAARTAVEAAQKTAKEIQEAANRGDFSSTVSVESVVTAQPGEPAAVENVGTGQNACFRFTIPKGAKGDKGEDGTSMNISGSVESETELPSGVDSGTAYFVGDDIYVWDGTDWLNKGRLQGPPGKPATVTVGKVTDGEEASVENVGTESAAVFNFILPRGKDGQSVRLGVPEIEVDAGVGDPYAEVSIGGTDEEQVLRFSFHNLKGEPGTKGAIDENATVAFTPAEERGPVQSGETLREILGMLARIADDLKEVAFSGEYRDISGAPTKVSDLENDAAYVSTDTWKANTADSEGYVASGKGHAHQVWGTDAEGNPGWVDRVKAEDLEKDFVSKAGDTVEGKLKVRTLVIGTAPSEEVGGIWIE